MRGGIYFNLAATGIRKNSRLYVPYILTGIGTVMMFYVIAYLASTENLKQMNGITTAQQILSFGCIVMGIFSVIFLFYTNSFLMRRRKKEFGLYNILGMDKKSIAKILFCETAMIMVLTIAAGLFLGAACSKLAELIFANMIRTNVVFRFELPKKAFSRTVLLFGVVYLLLLFNSLRQVHLSNPIELLHSEMTGEKAPKANWLIGILGAAVLGWAYYTAVSIKSPLASMIWFVIAAIAVIIATYMLFVAGSVVLCRILQRNKNYYYKPNHFVSVSSMSYRMKRNGAGLASICILLTMVLVMIASTSSLYFGAEDSLRHRYPRNIIMGVDFESVQDMTDNKIEKIRENVLQEVEQYGAEIKNIYEYRMAGIVGVLTDGRINPRVDEVNSMDMELMVAMIPLSDYNRLMDRNISLDTDEVLLYSYRSEYGFDTVQIDEGPVYRAIKPEDEFVFGGDFAMNIVDSVCLIVPDLDAFAKPLTVLANFNGDPMLQNGWECGFDLNLDPDGQSECYKIVSQAMKEFADREELSIKDISVEAAAVERAGFFSVYGGFFFLGILLSIVFISAAVLIIYYKQISEGYEDQARFEIMKKVGMTNRDIRRSINSQMIAVFMLPIIGAVLHLAFALPMLRKLLLLFNLDNVPLLLSATGLSVLVFTVFYIMIYRLTAGAYYSIVSRK